ncbi:AIR carboxylase family protein [Candidatus Gracilibacteria bacterium]|nr:AIR carboxylase family protein [Candidatus Gracilibacteria bacterium]
MLVPILLGSESDKDHAQKIGGWLEQFGIPHEIKVMSAHKVPEKLFAYIQEMNKQKNIVFVTIAGRSNGLSGVTAGSSVHPVIACPPFKDKDDYSINIHSTLQMPSDTPVLAVLDTQNCALAIARIFAMQDPAIAAKVAQRIEDIKATF